MESLLELVKLALLLVEVLDEPSSPLLHLMKSALESFDDTGHGPLNLSPVLGVPDIVSDELFDRLLPLLLKQVLVSHDLELVHESVHIFDQDVISSDQDLLLLASLSQGLISWSLVRGGS